VVNVDVVEMIIECPLMMMFYVVLLTCRQKVQQLLQHEWRTRYRSITLSLSSLDCCKVLTCKSCDVAISPECVVFLVISA